MYICIMMCSLNLTWKFCLSILHHILDSRIVSQATSSGKGFTANHSNRQISRNCRIGRATLSQPEFLPKHICGFYDHIKEILPKKGGGGGGGSPLFG